MNVRWAARLPSSASQCAAILRLQPGIKVCEDDDHFWLQGEATEGLAANPLHRLIDAALFEVLADGQLRPWSSRVPCGRLPDGPWAAITDHFRVELPVPRMGGCGIRQIPLSLVRSPSFEAANLIVARPANWLAYATSAPQWRLDRLSFATAIDGRVLIRGDLLPPIAGVRYYEQSGVALPGGWRWPDGIDAAIVSAALGLEPTDLALFSASGEWERLMGHDFVRASRSAVRLTVARNQEGRNV